MGSGIEQSFASSYGSCMGRVYEDDTDGMSEALLKQLEELKEANDKKRATSALDRSRKQSAASGGCAGADV